MAYADSCSTIHGRSTAQFSSKYKGVSCDKNTGRYEAYILMQQKKCSLGHYVLAADAALAIDRAHQRLGIKAVACFESRLEFTRDRTQEARKRDIELPLWQEVSEYLTSKVDNVVAGTKASHSSKNRHRNKQRCVLPLLPVPSRSSSHISNID